MPIVKNKAFKNKSPLVTAIIAAYNEEIHLADCVKSLINQNYKKLDIIIVENGESKDNTLKIAENFEKLYPDKVKAYSLKGKQKGPGPAWNYGVSKSKGNIVMICGADLRYGKDYVSKGIVPIINGESVGVVHKEELCDNASNLWARAFFFKRNSEHKPGLSRVFSLIEKSYVKSRPFNSALGYADDQTIYITEKTEFLTLNLNVTHTNPASFRDTWDHSRWVGRSIHKPIKILLISPVFPIYSLYKTYAHLKQDFYLPFLFFLPIYYSVRYFAYFTEAIKEIWKKNLQH